jgi:pimeloyl-ACP methyl ester carboxylesterase
LWYSDTGGDGPAIVFLHGFLMDATMFAPQIAALRGDYRCISVDQRGHGATEESPGPFTLRDVVDDVIALFDHLSLPAAVVVGMSQGGFVAQRLALEYPERIRALILMSTKASAESEETKRATLALFDDWAANGPAAHAGAMAALLVSDPGLEAEWIAKWERQAPGRVREPIRALLERESVLDRVGEIRCPVLQIHGSADRSVTLDDANDLHAALPNVQELVALEGGRHAPNLTHPYAVTTAMRGFLASLELPAAE